MFLPLSPPQDLTSLYAWDNTAQLRDVASLEGGITENVPTLFQAHGLAFTPHPQLPFARTITLPACNVFSHSLVPRPIL